jgi:hypothetical protein
MGGDQAMTSPHPFPEVVDATFIHNARACLRQLELGSFHHYKPQGHSVHLHAGAAFAKGLEVARHAYHAEGKPPADSVALGALALQAAYGDYTPPEGSAKSRDRMIGALDYYFQQWPLDTDTAKPIIGSNGPMIEFSFAEPLPILHPVTGNPLVYSGRADMVCSLGTAGTFIEDDKTASSLGAQWAAQWDLRSQFTGYSWAYSQIFGKAPAGVLVRGVSILKTKYDHAQAITYRPQWQIDRWLTQTVRDLDRVIEAWRSNYWDFNLDESCSSYGGCQFRQVCLQHDPRDWLAMYFERRAWNPITREETKL